MAILRRALVDEVYEAVLALLMDQEIHPGARVSIDGIARDLDVSPTPVREALARLESEGLVTKRALKGYTAARLLDAEGLRQLHEVRTLLEPAGAGLAAERLSPAEVTDLRALVTSMDASLTPGAATFETYREFADHDAEFHRAIAEKSGNELLTEAVARLRAHVHLYRLYYRHGIAVEALAEHESIVEALGSGDAQQASAAMREHLDRSYARMRSHVDAQSTEPRAEQE